MDDFENLFPSDGGLNEHFKEMEKQMFKIDASRSGVMPLGYHDFVDIFGEPNDEDLFDLTQSYIKLYLKKGDDSIPFVVGAYGQEWVERFLKYNEGIEEYELCSILKEHLDIYKKEVETSY